MPDWPPFEGSEKKVALTLRPGAMCLREQERAFWADVVGAARATVLSTLSNPSCTAFLLSESSLFVFDHRVILITCGRTTLVDAVEALLMHIPIGAIESLWYERKSEFFPWRQATSFMDDARRLHRLLPGRAWLFGGEDEHHLHLFHVEQSPYALQPPTLELLLYRIDPRTAGLLKDATPCQVRRELGLESLLNGFAIDDHLFTPAGYSLNALCDDRYFTLHITVQAIASFASVETNAAPPAEMAEIATVLAAAFSPQSLDVVTIDGPQEVRFPGDQYILRREIAQTIGTSCPVRFASHDRIGPVREPAIELPLV